MTYDNAKKIAQKLSETSYEVILDSLRDMPKEEFNKIPIIDAHTRIVAQRYATCFTHSIGGNFSEYYFMYLICGYLLREEIPNLIK